MARTLASRAAVRELLASLDLAPVHRLGQNFLVSEAVLSRILRTARLTGDDVVVEVGPGLGTLTCELLARVRAVVAIELDDGLAGALRRTCGDRLDRLALVHGDAARVGPEEIQAALEAVGVEEGPSALVANLPYSVAATVVLRMFETEPTIGRATVMVQREVADRMAATPGTKTYGAYTVKLALWAEVRGRFEVGRECFWPEPRVESAVVSLERRSCVPPDASAIAQVVDAAFAERRKTLANSLGHRGFDKGAVERALEGLGHDRRARAEALAPEEFVELARML